MKKIPLRQCIGCRQMRQKSQLIRVVKTPQDEIVLDTGNPRLDGRGAYLCRNADCFRTAQKKRALQRVFRGNIADAIIADIESFLTRLDPEETND